MSGSGSSSIPHLEHERRMAENGDIEHVQKIWIGNCNGSKNLTKNFLDDRNSTNCEFIDRRTCPIGRTTIGSNWIDHRRVLFEHNSCCRRGEFDLTFLIYWKIWQSFCKIRRIFWCMRMKIRQMSKSGDHRLTFTAILYIPIQMHLAHLFYICFRL